MCILMQSFELLAVELIIFVYFLTILKFKAHFQFRINRRRSLFSFHILSINIVQFQYRQCCIAIPEWYFLHFLHLFNPIWFISTSQCFSNTLQLFVLESFQLHCNFPIVEVPKILELTHLSHIYIHWKISLFTTICLYQSSSKIHTHTQNRMRLFHHTADLISFITRSCVLLSHLHICEWNSGWANQNACRGKAGTTQGVFNWFTRTKDVFRQTKEK